jgi:hypothetical protein
MKGHHGRIDLGSFRHSKLSVVILTQAWLRGLKKDALSHAWVNMTTLGRGA